MRREPAVPPRFWIPAVLGIALVAILVRGPEGDVGDTGPRAAALAGTAPGGSPETVSAVSPPSQEEVPEVAARVPAPAALHALVPLPREAPDQIEFFSGGDFRRRSARLLHELRAVVPEEAPLWCSREALAPFVLWTDVPERCGRLAALLAQARERLQADFLVPAGLDAPVDEPVPLALLSGLEYEECTSLQGRTWILVPEDADPRNAARPALHLFLAQALESRGSSALPWWLHAGVVERSLGAVPPGPAAPLEVLLLEAPSREPPGREAVLEEGGQLRGAASSFVEFCLSGDSGRDLHLRDALLDVARSYASGQIPAEPEGARSALARRFGVLDLDGLERRWHQRAARR